MPTLLEWEYKPTEWGVLERAGVQRIYFGDAVVDDYLLAVTVVHHNFYGFAIHPHTFYGWCVWRLINTPGCLLREQEQGNGDGGAFP